MPIDASRRQVLLLSALFGLSTVSGAVVVSAASIVGLGLSGREDLATLPVALALVGGTIATWPAARAMARWGRRAGFAGGTALAVAGAGLAAWGIHAESFLLFCLGSLALGVLGGVSPYYRFTAAEVAPAGQAPRAIGFVLAGGLAAGLAGPHLGAAARDLLAAPFAGAYLVMAALGVAILLLLPFLNVPRPPPAQAGSNPGRPLRTILRDRRAVAALLAAVTAFAAMVATMVAAPLSLLHAGAGFGDTALVIQGHIVAMFAPAFVAGAIVQRIGHGRTMALGLGFLAACTAVNIAGSSVAHHWLGLVLLGIGWNLLFVAATALLTTVHSPAEKARVQGGNDLTVAIVGAVAALGAGPLHGAVGWVGINAAVGLLVVACALGLAWALRPAPPAGQPVPGAAP